MSRELTLQVRDLTVDFATRDGTTRAVDRVSFDVEQRGSLGIVGESGCGKSTTAYALMRLLPRNGTISNGSVLLHGTDLVRASNPELRRHRWNSISMVFQNAMTALNPVIRISDQLTEAIQLHKGMPKREALSIAKETFEHVGLPASRIHQYPHEFSGGMKQRAVIALALVCNPSLVIADEPTTALDVVAQRKILELLDRLRSTLGVSLIMISHDISAVAETCDEILVMYAGQVVETGPTRETLLNASHPYTYALVSSYPALESYSRNDFLPTIDGSPPDLSQQQRGCRFADRCPFSQDLCRTTEPELVETIPGRKVRCHFAGQLDLGIEG